MLDRVGFKPKVQAIMVIKNNTDQVKKAEELSAAALRGLSTYFF
jgi:hypothetical protein